MVLTIALTDLDPTRPLKDMCNKFIELDSPLMPPSLPAWKEVLAALSRIQEEVPEGVNVFQTQAFFLAPLKKRRGLHTS